MSTLSRLAEKREILEPYGQTEVLLLYGLVAEKLEGYLKGKELASKIWLPSEKRPFLIKRGSKMEPLYVEEFARAVTPEFLEIRKEEKKLSRAKKEITRDQEKVWRYFVPRKLADFFYATNGEGEGRKLDRLFFDLDRGKNISLREAQEATRALVEAMAEDREFRELVKEEPFLYWTGNSFHVIFLLEEEKPPSFYDRYLRFDKNSPGDSFTGRWAEQLNSGLDFRVVGGHEKKENQLNIDPSQTPSGKLCRVPLGCLHMENSSQIDGVSLPLEQEMLYEENLASTLKEYGPEDIVKNLEELARRLS